MTGFTYDISDFLSGHGRRGIGGFNPKIHSPRLCMCGCGTPTKKFCGRFNRFIKGHENIGRTSWNKGKKFSDITRERMRLARLGKEPVNKAPIDLAELYKNYVEQKKTISVVSAEMGISKDAIKNRLRALGWSRSTKESCTTPAFRALMRETRIKALSSPKAIASPNKLERAVYDAIDAFGIPYQRQVPLLGKFVTDAFFPQRNLVLEIFGRYWHEIPKIKKKDFSKKRYLEKCGYHVEEIWDYQIKNNNVNTILEAIFRKYELA